MNTFDEIITDTCRLCGKIWYPDFHQLGWQWTCGDCRHPQRPCECTSDDITLDWHIVSDRNGDLCPDPMWKVECASCGRVTAYFTTPKEALDAWNNGYAEMVMEAL